MKINLILSGANGRMGQAIINAMQHDPVFTSIVKLTKDNYLEQLSIITKDQHNKLTSIHYEPWQHITVFIDFSTPNSCLEYIKFCNQLQIPMIIGTTGFSDLQYQQISNFAKSSPILLSPNMSIGANICQYLIASLSKLWSRYYQLPTTINLKDIHHKHKKDLPSGTALAIAEIIKQNSVNLHEPIKFVSKRLGEVKGKHQVTFSNLLEDITINHKVKERSVFATGALLAAKWLATHGKQHYNGHQSNCDYKLYDFFDVLAMEQ